MSERRACRLLRDVDVVFVEPLYDQNVGFIARAMKNFCLGRLVLVNPRCPLGVEAVKYSMHGVDKLKDAVIKGSFEDVVRGYDYVACSTGKRGSAPVRRAMTPEEMARRIVYFSGRRAIVIGREDRGLSNNELSRCDAVVTIPANPEYPILNASHAAAILFYAAYREALAGGEAVERPSRSELEAFIRYLAMLAEKVGVSEDKRKRLGVAVRRMLSETMAPRNDLRLLFGIVRRSYERITECCED